MESVRELQNPLLAKANGHLRSSYSYHQHHSQDYPNHHCQGKLYSYIFQNTGGARTHQLLDASSLQLAVEALYGPNFILVKDETALKAKDSKMESCETTFMESKEAPSEGPDGHEAQGSCLVESDIRIQTVSYEVEEEELQEYEVSFARWDGTRLQILGHLFFLLSPELPPQTLPSPASPASPCAPNISSSSLSFLLPFSHRRPQEEAGFPEGSLATCPLGAKGWWSHLCRTLGIWGPFDKGSLLLPWHSS